ncbi:DUF4328 domain-containing protein [Pseudomonas sp. R2.Fl]|nr:DUF4328 domain-containing protein [Pseudomonas sp. R2.Fl]
MPLERLRRKLSIAAFAWRGAANLCRLLLAIGAVAALYIGSLHHRLAVAGWMDRANFDRDAVSRIVRWAPLFDLGLLFCGLLCLIFWLRWVFLSARLVRLLDPAAMRYSPAEAVLGFLVPIVHFWMPIYALVDLEDFSAAQRRVETPALPVKPAAIVVLAVVAITLISSVFFYPMDDFSFPERGQWVMAGVATAALACLVMLEVMDSLVREVGKGQRIALEQDGVAGMAPTEP